jgi:hypothetical protein
MAGFNSLGQYATAVESGVSHYSTWRKTPSQVTTAGIWFDTSMSPGNPNPQYYAATPLIAQQMRRSTDGGINHGAAVTPLAKYLSRFLIMSASATGLPMSYTLCDYLLYYPFVDTGTNDEQIMDNTNTLSRYTDGLGVQMMAVSVAANSGTLPTFTVNYTNSDGVAGRTSVVQTVNAATANGSIITSAVGSAISSGPFIGLQSGDKGVRSVESVTFPSLTDVGLFSLVLVKPLLTSALLEQTAPSEVVPIAHQSQIPRIYDDAMLSLIVLPNGSLSGVAFHGEIETTWN